jgi:RHS repeat-associated protein
MARRNRVVDPTGTIDRTVYDVRGLTVSTWAGTDDRRATDADPTGGGAAGNNMVRIAANEYDGGSAGGDGNLTGQTLDVDATTTRVTTFTYDFRDRLTATDGEEDFYQEQVYDNLSQVIRVDHRDGGSGGNLVARDEADFDDRGRVYRTRTFAVDPTTGTVGNSLVDNTWYDASGNTLCSLPVGSQAFTKMTYDGVGRTIAGYIGYNPDDEIAPDSVEDDLIFQQTETEYDAAGNVTLTTSRLRWDNATGTGPLRGPSDSQPKSRDSYVATWCDGVGRSVASADYGTNADAGPPVRPDSPPEPSDGVLVSLIAYNARGESFETVDPAGQVSRAYSDDAGRAIRTIKNYVVGEGCFCPGAEENVVVEFEYGPGGLLAKLIAFNADTGNQVTRYQYGVGLDASDLASNRLLLAEILPNAADSSDRVIYGYNRQGQAKSMRDRNGSVHAYAFDGLGRLTADAVTVLAAGVDGGVRRIGRSYEVRGMVESVTSYSDAAGTTIANQVQNVYNNFAQLAAQYQEHDGAVNTGTTPRVQYGYADGSANTIRPTSMTYPNGYVLEYQYSGDDADNLSRLNILHTDEDLVEYGYLGLGVFIRTDYLPPGVRHDLSGGTGPNRYPGLDRFGRIIDLAWRNVSGSSSSSSNSSSHEDALIHLKYGYGPASNRTYRQDLVAQGYGKNFDELYEYDGLDQLKKFHRGQLAESNTVIEAPGLQQSWRFDASGNWKNFTTFDPADAAKTLDQQRQHNAVNEITIITRTVGSVWATPAFDRNGNMLTDENGQQYEYDVWNRLVAVKSGVTVLKSYGYDGLNHRVTETASGVTTDLIYSTEWQVLEEQVEAVTTQRYVWGPIYVDAMVLRDRDADDNGTLDERLWAVQDANWNVTAIVDGSGAVLERYAHDPFGEVTIYSPTYGSVLTASNYAWTQGFQGMFFDAASGTYKSRIRTDYSPTLGRPIQSDPLQFGAGDVNFYRWEGNNPGNVTDPSGLDASINGAGVHSEIAVDLYLPCDRASCSPRDRADYVHVGVLSIGWFAKGWGAGGDPMKRGSSGGIINGTAEVQFGFLPNIKAKDQPGAKRVVPGGLPESLRLVKAALAKLGKDLDWLKKLLDLDGISCEEILKRVAGQRPDVWKPKFTTRLEAPDNLRYDVRNYNCNHFTIDALSKYIGYDWLAFPPDRKAASWGLDELVVAWDRCVRYGESRGGPKGLPK